MEEKRGKSRKRRNDRKHELRQKLAKSILLSGTFLAAILAVMQIFDWVEGKKNLEIIVQNGISIKYLSKNDERFNDIYPLFQDYIGDGDNVFSENCAIQLMVTNHHDTQVVVDKIIFEAEEINVDAKPVLHFFLCWPVADGLQISIGNNGWGDARNLSVTIDSPDYDLREFIREEALCFEIPDVKSGEIVETIFLRESDIIKTVKGGMSFSCIFNVECESESPAEVINEDNTVAIDENGKFVELGRGSNSENVYGIKINTDNTSFKREENISEQINAGDTLVLPICFFPDKSCSMNFKISFEVVCDGKKSIISSDINELVFQVSSIPGLSYERNQEIN